VLAESVLLEKSVGIS
jgi:hypothetical protein